jgi:hypothetical protein
MRGPRASAAPSIAGPSRPASERRRCRRHQFQDPRGEFDHDHCGGAGLAKAQVETAGLTFLWRTLATRFDGGAAWGVLGFISARASSGEVEAAVPATAGSTAATTGGGTMVGMEVSNTTLSGHLRADWMRRIMLLAESVGVCTATTSLAGAGAALGHTQSTMKIIASSTLPTHRKYRPNGTAFTSPSVTVLQRDKCALKFLFQTRSS